MIQPKKRWLALGLALWFCLTATACHARQSKYGDAFRFPLSAEPLQLDPQVAEDAASVEVLCAMMEGLTRLSETGEVLPGIAESWNTSKDGKTVTFSLRSATWSDKTAVTAEDFAFAFERAVDPATRSPLKDKFANVEKAVAADAHTFTVTLKAPDEAFAYKMADSAFFPCQKSFFEKSDGRYGMETQYVLSNGPFVLSSWSHGEYLILRKNAEYYATKDILPNQVRYVLNVDSDETVSLLKDGGLDAARIPADKSGEINQKKMTTETVHDSVFALWFNADCDDLHSAAVRTSLCSVLDLKKLAAVWEQEGERTATSFLPPDTTCQNAPYVQENDTFGTVPAKKATLSGMSQLTLLCGEDELSVELAQQILQTWQKQYSLYFKLEKLPLDELTSRVESGDYELALYAAPAAGGTAKDGLSAFVTGKKGNLAHLSDKTFDTLYNEAVAADTREAYKKAEARLFEVCPCLPLYDPETMFAFGENVKGVHVRPFGGGVHGAVFEFREAEK